MPPRFGSFSSRRDSQRFVASRINLRLFAQPIASRLWIALILNIVAARTEPASIAPSVPLTPLAAVQLHLDSNLAEERRFYWCKCAEAHAHRRASHTHAYFGLAVALADVPAEIYVGQYQANHKQAVPEWNILTFAAISFSLYHFSWSFMEYSRYAEKAPSCRYASDLSRRE